MWNLKNKINEQNSNEDTENKLMAATWKAGWEGLSAKGTGIKKHTLAVTK